MPIDLSPDAFATFAALLTAHLLGDYIFQTASMVAAKRKVAVFALHVALHGALALALLGGVWQVALAAMLAHAVIDALKTYALTEKQRETLTAYLVDQAAHLLTLAAASFWVPEAYAAGLWGDVPLLPAHLLLSGALLATFAGGPMVGLLMRRFTVDLPEGLAGAGRMIGLLERGLIYLMVMVGEPTGIGFLIAAKSVLRFDSAKDHRSAEYVIIGTLASFGWAMLIGVFISSALAGLEPAPPRP